MVVLGRVHGEVEKCFDLISDLKCRDDRYPGRCRRGFGSWGGVRWVRCALGEVVVFPKRRSRWRAGTGAGGVPPPYPASPIDTPPGGRQPLCRLCEQTHRNPVSSPLCTAIRSIAMHCPPPRGGGRRPRERPGGGGDPAREVFGDTGDRGGGCSTPLPVSPTPVG